MSTVRAIMDMAYSWGGLLIAAVFWYLLCKADKRGTFEQGSSAGWAETLVYLGMCFWVLLSAAMILIKLVAAITRYANSGCLL